MIMRYHLTFQLLLLFTSSLFAQVATLSLPKKEREGIVTMYQPRALLSAYDADKLLAVDFGNQMTCIVTHAVGWEIPAATYASDEADRHYPLVRVEKKGTDLFLVFEAMPQTTRLLDVVFEGTPRRWMGIHSGVRALQFPTVRPQLDENALVPDSIGRILRANELSDLLSTDSTYAAISHQLTTFRNYVAWKWKLTPHQFFLLQRSHERIPRTANAPTSQGWEGPRSAVSQTSGLTTPSGGAGGGSPGSALRTLPRAPKPTRRQLKRLSRFEQKMLQEQRHPQP